MINNIVLLQKAGYFVCVADKNPDAPAFDVADNFRAIDIADPEAIFKYARDENVSAIIAVNDAGVFSAAYASEKLGLTYHSLEVAKKCTDKGLMREAWLQMNLSQPEFIVVSDVSEIRNAIYKIGIPCIIKPCLNWGSKGVSAINNEDDISIAIQFALENNRNGRFIIEKLVGGFEVTVEGLVQNGISKILARSDKEHQDHARFKVAMALNYPAKLNESTQYKLDKLIHEAIESLGIKNGAFHAECMIDGDEIYLVEMGGRPGGGHIFGYIVEAVSGICMPVALASILLNKNLNIEPIFQRGSCYKFFNAPVGVFRGIENLDIAKSSDGILDLGFKMENGKVVGDIAGDADRPGYIVSSAETRELAIEKAKAAKNKIINHV
jgi:biotin carboxylase